MSAIFLTVLNNLSEKEAKFIISGSLPKMIPFRAKLFQVIKPCDALEPFPLLRDNQ